MRVREGARIRADDRDRSFGRQLCSSPRFRGADGVSHGLARPGDEAEWVNGCLFALSFGGSAWKVNQKAPAPLNWRCVLPRRAEESSEGSVGGELSQAQNLPGEAPATFCSALSLFSLASLLSSLPGDFPTRLAGIPLPRPGGSPSSLWSFWMIFHSRARDAPVQDNRSL
jgi:hypothetical protein